MGLEIQAIDTDRDINLAELHAVLDAVIDKFDWHLAGDKRHAYNILSGQAERLTKGSVMDKFKDDFNLRPSEKEDFDYLNSISDDDFARHLRTIAKSIRAFNENDTHLSFDYEKLPTTELDWCCSSNMKTALERCSDNDSRPYRDYVVELSEKDVLHTAKKWRGLGCKLSLTKWIGYFKPDAAQRIVEDICQDMDISDSYVDLGDLINYRKFWMKILKSHTKGRRIWLISSY